MYVLYTYAFFQNDPLLHCRTELGVEQRDEPAESSASAVAVKQEPKDEPEEGMLSDLEDDFLDNILDENSSSSLPKTENSVADVPSEPTSNGNDVGPENQSLGNEFINRPPRPRSVLGPERRRRVYCDFCNYSSIKKSQMKRHVANKHKNAQRNLLYCPLCEYTSIYRTEYNEHLALNHMVGEGKYICSKCSYVSESKANLYRHFNTHSKKFTYTCPLCPFTCAGNLGRHVRSKHGVQLMKCDKCDFKTWNKLKLEDHINSHNGANKMFCNICHWSTYFRQSYKKHMNYYHQKSDDPDAPSTKCIMECSVADPASSELTN